MKAIIERAMEELKEHKQVRNFQKISIQKDLVADILEVYYTEHIKKTNEADDFFWKICKFAF